MRAEEHIKKDDIAEEIQRLKEEYLWTESLRDL